MGRLSAGAARGCVEFGVPMGMAVIAWHSTATGYTASVRIGAVTIARLHAHADRWELEHLDGRASGPAGSLGHAKRAALQALAELLPQAEFAVQAALRGT